MDDKTEFGRALRQLRRSDPRGVSLADIARVLDCSIAYVSAIERGQRNPPSNEKILAVLEFLGQEAEHPRMVTLAALARQAVEIPTNATNPELMSVLLGLARRSEEGLSDKDPLVAELKRVLAEDDEREFKCRPLFHESSKNRSGKSKTKRRSS